VQPISVKNWRRQWGYSWYRKWANVKNL